jgi:Secretion system C-terminal sorting domain
MIYQINKLIIIIPLLLCNKTICAQTSLNAATANANSATMQHTYSIAEMAIVHTAKSKHLIITQGQLQMDGIAVNVSESPLPFTIATYPNPASNLVNLELQLKQSANINWQLFDAAGKMVLSNNGFLNYGLHKLSIDVSAFANGYYILKTQIKINQTTYQQSNSIQKIN